MREKTKAKTSFSVLYLIDLATLSTRTIKIVNKIGIVG